MQQFHGRGCPTVQCTPILVLVLLLHVLVVLHHDTIVVATTTTIVGTVVTIVNSHIVGWVDTDAMMWSMMLIVVVVVVVVLGATTIIIITTTTTTTDDAGARCRRVPDLEPSTLIGRLSNDLNLSTGIQRQLMLPVL